MGVAANVGFSQFPRQGNMLGRRVNVCFQYDPTKTIDGVCVRNDMVEPFRTIFRLDDGRYVLASECQYSYDSSATNAAGQA